MKPLVGLLLVVSGTILSIPPLYNALMYLSYEGWPLVQVVLGIACIAVGLVFLVLQRKKDEKKFVEV